MDIDCTHIKDKNTIKELTDLEDGDFVKVKEGEREVLYQFSWVHKLDPKTKEKISSLPMLIKPTSDISIRNVGHTPNKLPDMDGRWRGDDGNRG